MKKSWQRAGKRIGILGGTFDPIHIGHLSMAKMAQEHMQLDQVIFVPSFLPPHKSSKLVALARHRLNMVRLAIKNNPKFSISDFEVKRPRKSYSIDTVGYFRGIFPSRTKIFFIIGEDSYSGLVHWKKIGEILKIVEFIVVNRPGSFKKSGKIKCHHIVMPGIDISSSYVRQRIRQRKTVQYFVPLPVVRYMERYQLYQQHK